MLQYLKLTNVGLAPELRVDWAPRLNLIAGDNGLGKRFLLDLAWWALTRTWAGPVALPSATTKKATIEYVVTGKTRAGKPVQSSYLRDKSAWPLPVARPTMPGIVIYIRIDGGFSVWDPARNYWRDDPGRPAAYHFDAAQVWDGLDLDGKRVCEGLERDWVNWQEARKPQFAALEAVLKEVSPPGETLRVGPPQRLFLGEGRDRPSLLIGTQTIPVALASAGIRRILALSYFLVWAWNEHRLAAKLLGKKPENRLVLLFDEPETHLHPRWQRTVIPSLLRAIDVLRETQAQAGTPQMMVATHSPLVAASLEPSFDPEQDDLVHLSLRDGRVAIEQGGWAKQGDVTSWLVSETFGLEQARSVEAERAIEAAEALMRGSTEAPPSKDIQRVHAELMRLLPAHDPFWPRWLLASNAIEPAGRRRR
ncbi:AAA family ATPase [Methyloversatilis discipulorum]|uniref:AAA family ATPase n=1 Tax=Methyloversatilis discipulorum TaxID=1119528 RepID=UPI003AF49B9C